MICPAGLLVDMEKKGSLLWKFVAFSPKDLGDLADGGWVYRGDLRSHCGARLPFGVLGRQRGLSRPVRGEAVAEDGLLVHPR